MVRVGIVGAGGIAGRHIDSLEQIADAQVAAVADTDAARAREVARSCGAHACESLEELFDLVDTVYILTPPSTHAQIACAAAAAGRHIVCEKPLAISVEDGARIVAAAKEAGVTLATAFKFRFHHGFIRLKEMVDSGSIGDLTSIWCQRIARGAGSSPEYNWRTDPALLCGMSIESLSHERIDVINDRNDLSGFVAENEHFIGCIRDGRTPDVTGHDGLRALEVSHAILESSRSGEVTPVAAQ